MHHCARFVFGHYGKCRIKFGHMSMWDKLRLKSGNPQTRRKIVDRLAASKGLKAVELLVECLCDEDEMVRRVAAEAFNRIKDERSITVLISALDDASCEVRTVA